MHIGIKQKFQLQQALLSIQGFEGLRQNKIRQLIQKSSRESLYMSKFTIIKKTKQLLKIIKIKRSLLNDHELFSTMVTIRNRYRQIKNSSKQIQYVVKKIQQHSPQLFKMVEKNLQKNKQSLLMQMKMKNNKEYHDENQNNLNKINVIIKNILTKKLMVNDLQCAGCIKFFQYNKPYQFNNALYSLIILGSAQFQNQQFLTDHLSALLNSKYSTIFISDFNRHQSSYLLKGCNLTYVKKVQYQSHVNKCLQYIQPKAQLNQDIYIQYIPLLKYQEAQEHKSQYIKDNYVMRIMLKRNRNRMMSYVSYKLNANKKIDYGFFNIKDNKLSYIQPKFLYKYIHNYYKITKNQLQNGATNRKINCQTPLPIIFSQNSSLKQQDQKKILCKTQKQPSNTKKTNIIKQMKIQSKFKFSLLITKNKQGDRQQKTIFQIQKDLGKQKILCSLQTILPQIDKYHYWIISYDCSGNYVQSVIKSYNKTGQYTVLRPKKTIKVTDQEFINQKRERVFIQKFRQMGGYVKECKEIDLKTLSSGKKKNHTLFTFKSMKESIYGFGLLQIMSRRVQFLKQQ